MNNPEDLKALSELYKTDWTAFAKMLLSEDQSGPDYTKGPVLMVDPELYEKLTGYDHNSRADAEALKNLIDYAFPGGMSGSDINRVKNLAYGVHNYRMRTKQNIGAQIFKLIKHLCGIGGMLPEEAMEMINMTQNAAIDPIDMSDFKGIGIPDYISDEELRQVPRIKEDPFVTGKKQGGRKHKKNPFKYK